MQKKWRKHSKNGYILVEGSGVQIFIFFPEIQKICDIIRHREPKSNSRNVSEKMEHRKIINVIS